MAEHTILIIDDDIDLVEILRIALESHGYRVIDAQNGERGLALAKQQNPDLILLDVMMGRVDEGFQVAYQLRSEEVTADTPILMLTAVKAETGFEFDPAKDKDFLPVNEFLEKPISPRNLVDMIRKHLPTNV
jgi:CheY-like chemotaxis protein